MQLVPLAGVAPPSPESLIPTSSLTEVESKLAGETRYENSTLLQGV